MTDETTSDTTDAPQVLSTTTSTAPGAPIDDDSADTTDGVSSYVPFTDTIDVAAEEQGDEKSVSTGYKPDIDALNAANAEPAVFAHELYEVIGHLTGSWIDEATLRGWFEAFGLQVRARNTRETVFQLANTVVPSQINGDSALNLLDFRDELVHTLRRGAGIA